MPASLEFKAKNVDKAVEKASAQLKIPKDKIKYDVLSYGSSGIFGLSGTKKAKIRVKLPEDSPAKKSQAQDAEMNGKDTSAPASDAYDQSEATGVMVTDDEEGVVKQNSEGQPFDSLSDDSSEMGRLGATVSSTAWITSSAAPSRKASPRNTGTRWPGAMRWSRTRVPLTLPRSSISMRSPKCSRACCRVIEGSSIFRSLFSERPSTMLPRDGRA